MSRVRVTAKSGCMDIDVVMPNEEATAFIKKLRRIQKRFIKGETRLCLAALFQEVGLEPHFGVQVTVPDSVDQSFKIKIEPEGESTG